jgi:hypothetical protein
VIHTNGSPFLRFSKLNNVCFVSFCLFISFLFLFQFQSSAWNWVLNSLAGDQVLDKKFVFLPIFEKQVRFLLICSRIKLLCVCVCVCVCFLCVWLFGSLAEKTLAEEEEEIKP